MTVALRNSRLQLVPEWGERIPESHLLPSTGRKRNRACPITSCERCGIRHEENQSRRNARLEAGLPYVCWECRYSDPEYVKIVGTSTKGRRMPRLPYAAEQLIEQAKQLPGLKTHDVDPKLGDPDGFDVIRELTFDQKTTSVLWPLLEPALDGRIASAIHSHGTLTLTFSPHSVQADDRSPFALPATPADAPEEQTGGDDR